MLFSQKKNSQLKEVLGFTYPRLHTGKSWYVDFLSYDPALGKLRRKKYMLDSIPRVTERRKRATEMIESLLKLLRAGWSPWVSVDDNRGYRLLSDAMDKYGAVIDKFQKEKTKKDYSSRLKILKDYIGGLVLPPRYAYQYDVSFVSEFLDWLYIDREVSARTRNNYRGWCSAFAEFMIERGYIGSNPCEKIKLLDETPKKRQPLSAPMLAKLSAYLRDKDPMFLLACMMEYYMFIRPLELAQIRICDISLRNQSIYVSAAISKNKRDGCVGLNDDIARLMIDLRLFDYPGDYYVFGAGFRPSSARGESQMFRRRWTSVRKVMKWDDEYQFYSLKDSGIRDLANAEGIVIARDQARHTDISTTNKYLQGRDMPVHDETRHFKGFL